MRAFTRYAVATIAVLGLVLGLPPLFAQVTVNQTTLSSAATITARDINLTSASTVAVDDLIVVDGEAMRVLEITGTRIRVFRGFAGSKVQAHASGAVAFTGVPQRFSGEDPRSGGCTATAERFLPRVLTNGTVYQCHGSAWVRYRLNGIPSFTNAPAASYSTTGAIAVQPGLSLITAAGVGAMTLVPPTALQSGMVMEITSNTAQAHTITITEGFNNGGATADVCTLGAVIGNGVTIRADGLHWYMIAARGCTLG
jgi:hypothetical protein